MKRPIDLAISLLGLLISIPVILLCSLAIWVQDWKSPFYVARRVGRNGQIFSMIKLRSMIWNAEQNKVDSTTKSDSRITPVGKFIRKFKIDELPQFMNVALGDMSIVGPRPNVERETNLYTQAEKEMLTVRPGITDMSSIVFSDLAAILEPHEDPNIAYNQLVRPWKSRLSILCIRNSSIITDLKLVGITIISALNRSRALRCIDRILANWNANEQLRKVASRKQPLKPHPPLGANKIVLSRNS